MASTSFLTNRNVGSNGYTSPTFTVPNGLRRIALAITSAAWTTKTGSFSWRIEYLDGVIWHLLVGDDPKAIGQLDRIGALPKMAYSTSKGIAGKQLRLVVSCSQVVRIDDVTAEVT